jgi:hypothetical protein
MTARFQHQPPPVHVQPRHGVGAPGENRVALRFGEAVQHDPHRFAASVHVDRAIGGDFMLRNIHDTLVRLGTDVLACGGHISLSVRGKDHAVVRWSPNNDLRTTAVRVSDKRMLQVGPAQIWCLTD